jgi:hypothetical protein
MPATARLLFVLDLGLDLGARRGDEPDRRFPPVMQGEVQSGVDRINVGDRELGACLRWQWVRDIHPFEVAVGGQFDPDSLPGCAARCGRQPTKGDFGTVASRRPTLRRLPVMTIWSPRPTTLASALSAGP